MEPTPALEAAVHHWADKLVRVYDRIERGHVTIARPHQRHHSGQHVHVHVQLSIPGPDIVVSHDHFLDPAHEDAYVAIRDAFAAARRQLQDLARKTRKDVKTRVVPDHGRVTFVDVEGQWGFLDSGGRQVYFHHNAVVGGPPLAVGEEVRFTEGTGDRGPQATSVARIGHNGHHELPPA